MITYRLLNQNGEFIKKFDIYPVRVHEDSLLGILYRRRKDKSTNVVEVYDPTISNAVYYLNNALPPVDEEKLAIIDYWGITRTYSTILDDELFMHTSMYKPEFDEDMMNLDQYYNLSVMNTFSENYNPPIEGPDVLSFTEFIQSVPSYKDVKRMLSNYKWLFDVAEDLDLNIVMAGESIFDALMGVEEWKYTARIGFMTEKNYRVPKEDLNWLGLSYPNTNVFFTTYNLENIVLFIEEVAETIILQCERAVKLNNQIEEYEVKSDRTNEYISITGILVFTKDAKTKSYDVRDKIILTRVRINLGVYKTFSEVVHGFVVDCECIGWDGEDVWVTERCMYTLYRGYNLVDDDIARNDVDVVYSKYAVKGIGAKPFVESTSHVFYLIKQGRIIFYVGEEMYYISRSEHNPDQCYSLSSQLFSYKDKLVEHYYDYQVGYEAGYLTEEEMIEAINSVTNFDEIESLSDDVDFETNEHYKVIIIQKDVVNSKDIINMMSIDDTVYKLMIAWPGTTLTKDVEINLLQPGDKIRSL